MSVTGLAGRIERVVFHNAGTGYIVARLRPAGRKSTVCIVGNVLQELHEGDEAQLQGEWKAHPKYGDQFQFSTYHIALPTDADGIERYLGSGLIKGIGKGLARRIVEKFGADTLRIVELEPDRLSEVKGLSEKKIASILEKWADQRDLREALIFFQGHGVTPGQATKIFKRYGRESIAETKRNPYRLVEEIWGIGFKSADDIAMKIGFDPQSPLRAEAAILHVLDEAANQGHVYLPRGEAVDLALKIVPVDAAKLEEAVTSLIAERRVIQSGIALGERSLYLAPMFYAEKGVAEQLAKLLQAAPGSQPPLEATTMEDLELALGILFSEEQKQAVALAGSARICILTGGPGTGKTTIVKALVHLLDRTGTKIALAAPTGKAAKRMTEATGRPAITIHRLLEFNPALNEFARNSENPLECGNLILDECSMIDLHLMYALLKALPVGCRLVLVGDKDQLPSVRAGNLLRDVIACGRIPIVELKRIYRQSEKSHIATNAHRIKDGNYPILSHETKGATDTDFFFVVEENEERILAIVKKLYMERIPKRLFDLGLTRYDPFSDSIQVISPMYRGVLGVDNLNATLQDALNPSKGSEPISFARDFRNGDKVIQLRNNYKKEVFNGEMGRVSDVDDEEKVVVVNFDGRMVPYEATEVDELALAYALTVHKSQGSEFEAVIMPLLMSHSIMLDRNLLYTAVSRAKKLLVLIGAEKALRHAIRNNKPHLRYTHLMDRIVEITEKGSREEV